MANSEALSGVHTYGLWATESTYNTAVTPNTHISATTQNIRLRVNNQLVANYAFSGDDAVDGRKVYSFTPGVLDLSGSVEAKITNWGFLTYGLGDFTIDTYSITAIPASFTLGVNVDNPGSAATDLNVTASGGVLNSFTIRSAVGEPVMFSGEMKFAKFVVDSTIDSRVALPSEDVYDYAGGSIQLPSGSTLSNIIDSVELSVSNNFKMLAGLGSRLVQKAIPEAVVINVSVTLKYLDNALVTAALGATTPTATGSPTEYATFVLVFAKGGNTMTLTLSGVPLSEFEQIHQLQDPVAENLKFTAKSIVGVES